MLGWHISVFRQETNLEEPPSFESPSGARIAVWQTGLDGLDWVDELIEEGKASLLGGNGYPLRFTAQASVVIPIAVKGPPHARKAWVSDPGDILTSKWEGKTTINEEEANACAPSEWLILEVWDES
jgi:hypothetical protein